MKKSNLLLILIFLANIPFLLSTSSEVLDGDYPYSIKFGYNEAVTFLSDNTISLFNVISLEITNYILPSTSLCKATEERSGIYLDGYFYLSCINNANPNEFQIKVYKKKEGISPITLDDAEKIYPNTGFYQFKSHSSIRFFVMHSDQVLVVAAWMTSGKLYLKQINGDNSESPSEFPVEGFGRDIDCIYVSKFQRLVCSFGLFSGDKGIYECGLNIFKDAGEFVSNRRAYDCSNHLSRKLRGNTDVNEDSDFFYYYFVDTASNAYISKVTMTSSTGLNFADPILIMKGCSQYQHSFDLAEDKFLGYQVFSCVDSQYSTKIKIQLFKIEDDKAIFYGNKNIEDFETFTVGQEASMINFIVLKDSLNFGFLSYRNNRNTKAYYTLFTQPLCHDMTASIVQDRDTDIDFSEINDLNYGDANIDVFEWSPGLEVTSTVDPLIFNCKSVDYKVGDLEIKFKVNNNYFESSICKITVTVQECYKYCGTCEDTGTNQFDQKCKSCKEGLSRMNFPYGINSDSTIFNCCEKGVDCGPYLYEHGNVFKICDDKCTTCEGSPGNCLTCKNNVELSKFSSDIKTLIEQYKLSVSDVQFYWNLAKDDCIPEADIDGQYLDKTEGQYKECYKSCIKCEEAGDSNNHNCKSCNEQLGYYHIDTITSKNCYKEDEKPTNYYLNEDDPDNKILLPCHEYCHSCEERNDPEHCTSCATNTYPRCDKKNDHIFQCYKNKPADNYFFDIEQNCFQICSSNCKTCDKSPESPEADAIQNCLDCAEGMILFNKNCYNNCPSPYKQLGDKICVVECPPYTQEKPVTVGTDTFQKCFNCKDTSDQPKYKYMGTRHSSHNDCMDEAEIKSLAQVFIANDEYNIVDDCYDLCHDCKQRGTSAQMNCVSCISADLFLVEGIGNCIPHNMQIDFYYETIESVDAGKVKYIYKKCFETCKKCSGEGNVINHNCTECKDGYQFDPINTGNCVIKCEHYWYIDSKTKKFICTEEPKCPEDQPYFTELNKGCVEQCSGVVHSAQMFFYRYKKTCITKCPENSMRDDLLYVCHSLENEKDIFVYLANYISQSTNVYNLLLYSEDGTKLFHLFNTTELGMKTYKNNSFSVGTSIIDLSVCLNTLRNVYGFTRNEVFYIGVLDVIRNDTSAPQFEYTIYNHLGTKLDINYCKNNELVIEKSLNHSTNLSLARNILDNYGYDIIDYQKNNKFFCDICSTFDSDKLDSYDVLLDDRYDYYYDNQNYYFCEDTCKAQSTEVNLTSLRVKCVCSGKTNFTSYKKQTFQKYSKFTQNCKDEFLQYFKCGKKAFSKELFTKNVGHYFTFFFILFQIGNIFLYYYYSKKPMMSHINDVLVKRAKKGYEDDISSSQSESESGSSEVSGSGSYTGSGSQSGSRSGSRSQSGSGSYTGSGSQSGSRSGSGSQSGSGSYKPSQSGSGEQEGSQNEEENESENQNGSQSGSQSGSGSGSGSGSKTGSKSKKNSTSKSKSKSKKSANPPKVVRPPEKKKEKNYAFISIDNNNNDNKKEDEDEKNMDTSKNLNINNIITEVKEEQNSDISSKGNKNAPNPAWKKYAKRYLNNENNYIDNEYREDSYNFDIPQDKKKKSSHKSDDDNDESNEEEDEKSKDSKKDEEKSNNSDNNYDISEKKSEEYSDTYSKPKSKKSSHKNKNEELPPAMAPFKTDLEKFKDEIKKFEKFSLIELYWFILRKKHRLISLLIKKDVYDIFSIKLSLLILSYTIDFFVTTLFFFNSEIKKLFHIKKHLEPIYIIFMGLFCVLISTALIKVVDSLMEYRTNFRRYEILQKYENDRSNYFSSLNAMIKGFKQKMIIYYVLMFAFSVFVWYMVSTFISTYYNTKLIWGCMIGVNFGLSNIFPFLYYFLGVFFQYKGIHTENYKMYKLGLIMIKI